jgi:hypothetical protein
MDRDRLRVVFSLIVTVAQAGEIRQEHGAIISPALDTIRARPRLPGHDVTDDEIREVLGMTLGEILGRRPAPER